MEIPDALVAAAAAYIVLSALLLSGLALLASPVLVIARRRARFFDDWNAALRAPWLFWHIGGLLFRIQELIGNYVLPAPQRAVIVVNELGLPDLLAARGAMTGPQLAAATGCHPDYLERVLRLAARMGLLRATRCSTASPAPAGKGAAAAAKGRGGGGGGGGGGAAGKQQRRFAPGALDLGGAAYELTSLSAVLCEAHPNSVKAMVSLFGDHYGAAGCLLEGVRSGKTPYEVWSGGPGHWAHMDAVPELRARFNRAMAQFNNLSPVEGVFMAYPELGAAARVVDVGGGVGGFLAAALARHPALRGEVFDLPAVVKAAARAWAEEPGRAALAARAGFAGGSFFDAGAIPRADGDRDVYVMREILHDWSDADALRILREVRAAAGRHAGVRLVIVEACISMQMGSSATARIGGDVHMLVQYGGARERTEAQFDALLAGAGWELRRVIPTKGLFFVLEAAPA
ncbi:MAG: O-methyltransferase-domain-containing protein [Monoraphidium minutum]|nr:MAG: O-methyltransferase-domain-containing protein [Monoraphidium minutum]